MDIIGCLVGVLVLVVIILLIERHKNRVQMGEAYDELDSQYCDSLDKQYEANEYAQSLIDQRDSLQISLNDAASRIIEQEQSLKACLKKANEIESKRCDLETHVVQLEQIIASLENALGESRSSENVALSNAKDYRHIIKNAVALLTTIKA